MKQYFFLFFLLCLVSCVMDRISLAQIVNNSQGSITIRIYYDRQYLDSIYNSNPNINFLKNDAVLPSNSLISFDEDSLIASYLVQKGGVLEIYRDSGAKPGLRLFQSIAVQTGNGTTMYSRETILSILKEEETSVWQWYIQ